MASRRKYPSDHRSYFRVMESILDDPALNALSLADQALYFRLLAVLNRQESKDGWGFLDQYAGAALVRRERWAYAQPAYDRLAAGGLVRTEYRDGGVAFLIDKWPEIQGFAPATLRRDSDETPPLRGEEKRGEEKREERAATAAVTPLPNGDAASAAWNLGLEAASAYRPTASTWKLTDARKKPLQALLREHPDEGSEVFARVVHGYRYARRTWAEVEAHFEPETLLRAANRAKYLEAYQEAVSHGLSPPFQAEGGEGAPLTAERIMRLVERNEREQRGRS